MRNLAARPRLTQKQILSWADAYRARTGVWPRANDEPVAESAGDTWHTIQQALNHGLRGLRAGNSLFKVLARHRRVTRHVRRPPLTEQQILVWADAFHRRTQKWPRNHSGMIPETRGESWRKIDKALRCGERGLPGGNTLAKLIARHRGLRYHLALPPLTDEKILRWARAYRRRRGRWPNRDSGPIPNSNGETWGGVGRSLRLGRRGLKRRISLL